MPYGDSPGRWQISLMEDGRAEASWTPTPDMANPFGSVHGGIIATVIDELTGKFPPLKDFVIPGHDRVSAALDVARTAIRRAERSASTGRRAAVPASTLERSTPALAQTNP